MNSGSRRGSRLEINHKELWVPYAQRVPSDSLGQKSMYAQGKMGYVRVELARRGGDGRGGDGSASTVTWNGNSDLTPLAGKPVFVRFHLVAAELYGMRFAD